MYTDIQYRRARLSLCWITAQTAIIVSVILRYV
nr:MAG TPA: hypothetical protein [Bacteriophage sp.]